MKIVAATSLSLDLLLSLALLVAFRLLGVSTKLIQVSAPARASILA